MNRRHRRGSRLRVTDLLDEVLAGVLARPARAVFTTLGTVLGLASLVATLGISRTSGNQIVERFDALQATEVSVVGREQTATGGAAVELPWDVEARLDHLNGAVASGARADIKTDIALRTAPVIDPQSVPNVVPLVAASAGYLDAVRGEIGTGRMFDGGHIQRHDRVVVIGRDVATRLGIQDLSRQPGVYVGDDVFVVIGVIDSARRDPALVGSVLLPWSVAQDRFGIGGADRVVIHTELGAARTIAVQAALALSPNDPTQLAVSAPADARRTQKAVESDLDGLFVLLGLISLVVGAIGIANVTLVTVMERTGEIGLRRALGAGRRHIALQILGESAVMGFVGGVIGASAGTIVVVVVSAQRQWTPVLDPWLPIAAPPAGIIVGLIAGLYPSIRAARMEPIAALRAGT